MAARDHSTAAYRTKADPLANPDLGWGPFGYSRRKTKALLGLAASLIEELTDQIVRQQSKQTETEARLLEVTAESEKARVELEVARAELARLSAEIETRRPDEAERTEIAAALISAHQTAAEIIGRARRNAEEIVATARSDSSSIEEEANHVIEQAEIRAQSLVEHAAQEAESLRAESEQLRARIERELELWTRFLRRALDAADQADAAEETNRAAEQPMNVDGEQEHPEVEKDDREVEEKDLEGDLYGAIKGTDEP